MGKKSLLAAMAAGIALGMLMAPEKGSDARKKITESLDKLKDRWDDIRNLKNISVEDLKELKEIFRQNISGLSDEVRKKILQIIESARPAKEELKAEPA
ncbi:MAG: YtxH domain-containing protein [Chitinophagaceae bacterium]|nr:MAG: YtxH domain-containing protein [Chitinophagaceae bacterium]